MSGSLDLEDVLPYMLSKSPFNREISQYILPNGFLIPTLETYDGSTDPDEHLLVFKGTMNLYSLPDPAWCKLFSITLRGNAGRWFHNLEPESISTFFQLAKSFQTSFFFHRKFPRKMREIYDIRQGPDEPFIEFVKRFHNRILDIGERSDLSVISAFMDGVQSELLFSLLTINPPSTLEDLMARAHRFHWAQEATVKKKQRDAGSTYSSNSFNQRRCILEFNGTAPKTNPGRAGAGVVLRDEDLTMVYYLREGLGIVTKGVAEYQALVLGLRYAFERGFTHITVQGDAKHVCMQVNGVWKTKSRDMSPDMTHWCQVEKLKEKFHSFQIIHVEKEDNSDANAQAKLALELQYGEIEEGMFGDSSYFEPLQKRRLQKLSSAYK